MREFDFGGELFRRRSPYGPIGVEFSLEAVHLVQLQQVGEDIRVHEHRSLDYPRVAGDVLAEPETFSQLIAKALKLGRFRGREAIAAMPASHVQVMPLSYQAGRGQDDEQAISQLVLERVGNEAAEFVVDYMPVETLRQDAEKLALVAICREESVVAYLELLRKAGLDVTALEIGPIAIRRLVVALQRMQGPQNTMVVNCGRTKTYLTLLSDSRLLADDEVEFGEEPLREKIIDALELDRTLLDQLLQDVDLSRHSEDPASRTIAEIIKPEFARLAQEIRRGFVFATSESRGARSDQVYLLGSIARWPGSEQLLASLIDAPVAKIPNPLALFSKTAAPPVVQPDSPWRPGLHFADLPTVPSFSLIPVQYAARRQRMRVVTFAGKTAVGTVVVCAMIFGAMQFVIAKERGQVAKLQEQREISMKQSQRLTALNDQKDELVRQWQLLESLRSGMSAWRMLRTVEEGVPDGEVWFASWQFRRAGLVSDKQIEPRAPSYFIMVDKNARSDVLQSLTHMAISGSATDHVALSQFAGRLLSEQDIDDVRVQRTNQVPRRGAAAQHVDFEMAIILKTDVEAG